MKNQRRTLGIAAATIVIAVLAWFQFAPGGAPQGQPPLVTLDGAGFDRLKTDFNRNAAETRLIVLLSPT